jgi:NADPH:quinone reductase-like Zn-dependent oxidoreductase
MVVHVKACSLAPWDVDACGRSSSSSAALGTVFSGVVHEGGAGCGDDDVVGVLPLDRAGACAEFVVVPPLGCALVVRKPAPLSHEVAAAAAQLGFSAFAVLHGKLRPSPGDIVLITDAASALGVVVAQLASLVWNACVIAVANSQDECAVLAATLKAQAPIRIVDSSGEDGGAVVLEAVREETAGIGVQHVVDLAVKTAGCPVPQRAWPLGLV